MSDSMQNDAMERLKQMYSKAQPIKSAPPPESKTHQTQKSQQKEEQTNQALHTKKNESVFDVFLKDKEKSLIVILIVLLISEKADTTLVLSLMYLIL